MLAALGLSALAMAVLLGIVAIDPGLGGQLSRENGVVEWLQAVLFATAAVAALRTAWDLNRAGVSPVFEILVAATLIGLDIGEVDLDKVLVGRKIISTRFFVDAGVPLAGRLIAALVLILPPLALAVYSWRRRIELFRAIVAALSASSGRVLAGGLLIFGVTELFEKPLGHVQGLPTFFVEESLELVAAIWFLVGIRAHRYALKRASSSAMPGTQR
jgi:hypothetical protein